MTDISLYSEDELIDELIRRSDAVVFARRKVLTETGKTERRRVWAGDKDACIGLCHGVIGSLMKDIWKDGDDD